MQPCGPGAQTHEILQFGAGVDDRAVGVARGDRPNVARLERDERGIEHGHAFGRFAKIDTHAALADARQCRELGIGEPSTDLARERELRVGTGHVAVLEQPSEAEAVLQPALFEAVDRGGLEQLGHPADPTTTAGYVALEPQRTGELGAEGRQRGGRFPRGGSAGRLSSRGRSLLVAPGQVRRM